MTTALVVIGAGIFGVTAAIELQKRGYATTLVDPGPIPHPLAASTDISKVIRMEYGNDEQYMEMMEASLPGWRAWNVEFGETLFHETGVTMFTRDEMKPGGFEYESFQMLRKRGHHPERLNADEISGQFPAWKADTYVDGFFHAAGGFAESGRVVSMLCEKARNLGVDCREGFSVDSIRIDNGRVWGVVSTEGETIHSDQVVVASGSWTYVLVPELAGVMRATGHPVFHLRPENGRLFRMEAFATFTADVARTGWYGFPLHPREGVVKIANHGVGLRLHPDDERIVTGEDEAALRRFVEESFPTLVKAPIVFTRRCLYCDTLDEHLWIDRHPEISGLTVASGGSGHGFKFAPILGGLIADAFEEKPNSWLPKFAWREFGEGAQGEEAARFHG